MRRRRGSIGAQRALGRSRRSADEIDAVLLGLVDRITRRMRAAGRIGRTVVLRLRFDDFTRATRSSTLIRATAQSQIVLDTARGLLATAMPAIERRGLTLVGLAVSNLENDLPRQLTLPLDPRDRSSLDDAVDAIRDRYGLEAINRAVLLGRDPGIVLPMLPD
jgi:DNA polymerase-4